MANELGIDKLSIEITANTSSATKAIGNLTKSLNKLNKAMSPISSAANNMNRSLGRTSTYSVSASKGMATYSSSAEKGVKSTTSFISKLAKLELSLIAIKVAVRTVSSFIASVFQESSSYTETLNKFNVAMGENTKSAKEYAESLQTLMGIDAKEFMDYQAVFANQLNGYGVASKNVKLMSQNLTQLAYDYSSLMDVNPQEAFEKLNSAMSGQVKGLKEYGNNVSVAQIKQTGLKYGLDGAVSSWDQNTQALMRYVTIMENAGKTDVFNDMARTIKTPANSIRILTNSITQLKRALGDIASIFIAKLIPYINAFVQVVTKAAKALATLFGFELPEIDYSGLGSSSLAEDTEDAANNLADAGKKAKELKKQLMGFDELNIINKPTDSSSGSSGSGVLKGIGDDISLPEYDFTAQLAKSADDMIDNMQRKLLDLFKPVTDSWDTYGKGVMESFEYKWRKIKELIGSVGVSLNEVWQNGTGETTMNHIFGIITNMNEAAGNLARNFTIAWVESDRGTRIMQNLADALNVVLGWVDNITKLFERWANDLDFKPLLQFVEGLTSALVPLANILGGTISSVIEGVILPTLKFIIENPLVDTFLAMSTAIAGISFVVGGLAGTLGTTLQPVFNSLFGLPFAQFFSSVTSGFKLVSSFVNPVTIGIALVTATIIDLWDESEEFRKAVKNIVSNISSIIGNLWRNVLYPIFSLIIDHIKGFIKNTLLPLWDQWKYVFEQIMKIVNDLLIVLTPIINAIVYLLGLVLVPTLNFLLTSFQVVFGAIAGVLTGFLKNFGDGFKNIENILSGIITFIKGVFTGNWKTAWEGIKSIFAGVWGSLTSIVRHPINLIIGLVNGMLGGIRTGINAVVNAVNKMSFKVPSWVPALGGKKFGFNLSPINMPNIPYLANGGLVDEGQMFIAREAGPELVGTMGNKTAVANNNQIIEGIKQGVLEAMSMANGSQGGTTRIVVQSILDGKTIGESVVDYNNGIVKQTGASPLMI